MKNWIVSLALLLACGVVAGPVAAGEVSLSEIVFYVH